MTEAPRHPLPPAISRAFLRAVLRELGAAVLLVVCSLSSFAAEQERTAIPASSQETSRPVYLRNSEAPAEIEKALRKAESTGRHVMLVVGGEWCPWCETLHRFYEEHPELVEIRERNFVTVHVYYGDEDKNEKALARFPKILSVPQFLVLNRKGMLLDSRSMQELEVEKKPDAGKFREFLMHWPAASSSPQLAR